MRQNLQFNTTAILIVDDNKDAVLMLTQAMSSNGFKVFAAYSASEGLRCHAHNPEIKIVFADLKLGGDMNGREMAVIMMEREPRTIVYAITGYSDKFLLDDCLRIGFKDYFLKPIDIAALLRVVDCSIERLRRWEQLV